MALVLGMLALAWRYTPLSEFVTADRVSSYAGYMRQAPWAPYAIVVAYTPAALTLFPRPLLTLLAVIAFGAWLGVLYAGMGIMLAALITYYAGRFISQERLRRLAGDRFESVSRVLRSHGIMAIFALNQTPAPPFVVQGLMAGACRVNAWHYALGSLFGMAPTLLAWTVFGDQLATNLQNGSAMNWPIVIAVVLVLVVLTFLVRRWFAKHAV
jgi:phospholipase D1/2